MQRKSASSWTQLDTQIIPWFFCDIMEGFQQLIIKVSAAGAKTEH